MLNGIRTIVPLIFVGAGVLLCLRGLNQYTTLHAQLACGDESGAELFEIKVYIYWAIAFVTSSVGAVLVGRWWFR